ncbi:serine/threonine-protein kinase [Streptomyces sp. SLBN-118]|uniref:serine/threonine-protein kinase n=1 Tax=Streptomyces sp. SLBN-118 TaxID=2768454 RepID=UPI00135A42CD|nr:serine/threonine-protein kinase [Streptomyces sp. SLBN-118]
MELLDGSDPGAIGGYPLLALLGEGGMGRVYLSRTVSGRPLALKTVRAEFGREPGFEERFAREIRNSDRVRSPWTTAVVDYSPAGQRPQWLATEYVAAPSLGEWVQRHGPLAEPSVLALAAELCGALRAVHEAGLAHRDVKPSNVLLGRRSPLLIDFGIARATEDSRHTRTGGVIGSPGYLAPEQASAGGSGAPGDVFSLAAVLVYAATGQGPFSHPDEEFSAAVLLYRIVHEEPNLDGVPAALVSVLRSCLAKNPQRRPSTGAVGALLERLGGRTGIWPQMLPEALERDLAVREDEAHALVSAAVRPLPVAAVSGESEDDPASGGAGTAAAPAAGSPRRRLAGRTAWTAAGGIAAVLIAAAGTLVVQHFSGKDASGATPSPSPTVAALPASWAGTWVGAGPGTPTVDGLTQARTDRFAVTLTLHPARRGELAGKQVSKVSEVGTGRELGCTEALQLREVRRTSMVFEAVTSHPTDQSTVLTCPKGNIYVVTMTGRDTLGLEAEGAQSAGAPSTLTRNRP